MKKIIVLVILFILFGFVIKIPTYHELNDLAIIKGVGVSYKNSSYTIYMKEIIPARSDDGIEYKYKIYDMQLIKETDIDKLPIQKEKEILMIYTCYPFNNIGYATQRYVIYAELEK